MGNGGKIWIRYDDLIKYSPIFVIIGRKYEESSFGSSPLAKDTEMDVGVLGAETTPEYINSDLVPPLADYIEK